MKKYLIALAVILITPMEMFAYAQNVIPGGENIGIQIESKGLVVVGFYKVDGKYIGSENLKVGDTILEVEGEEISTIDEMSKVIDKNIKKYPGLAILAEEFFHSFHCFHTQMPSFPRRDLNHR